MCEDTKKSVSNKELVWVMIIFLLSIWLTAKIMSAEKEKTMSAEVEKSFCKSNEKLEVWYFQPSDKESTTEKKWRCIPQAMSQGMP